MRILRYAAQPEGLLGALDEGEPAWETGEEAVTTVGCVHWEVGGATLVMGEIKSEALSREDCDPKAEVSTARTGDVSTRPPKTYKTRFVTSITYELSGWG